MRLIQFVSWLPGLPVLKNVAAESLVSKTAAAQRMKLAVYRSCLQKASTMASVQEDIDQDSGSSDYVESPIDRGEVGVDYLFFDDIISVVLQWSVDVKKISIENLFNRKDSEWIRYWHFMYRAESADSLIFSSLSSYQEYWRAMILLRLRIDLREKLHSIYPSCLERGSNCLENPIGFTSVSIKHLTLSNGTAKYSCISNEKCTNHFLLQHIAGPTVCLGFLEAGNALNRSGIMLLVCMEVEATGHSGLALDISNIPHTSIHIVGNHPEIDGSKNMFIKPILGIENFYRMYCSIFEMESIPKGLKMAILGREMKCPSYRDLRLDEGCESYLESIKSSKNTSHLLDSNQEKLIRKFLLKIGNTYEPGSITILEGSAGTGKTNSIIATIGAILHHSKRGTVGTRELNILRKRDGKLRCGKGDSCIRILICSENEYVLDSVMRQIAKGKIKNWNGGSIFPQMTRIAGENWLQPDLASFELASQVERFENVNQEYGRQWFANECVIFFSSLHECGSKRFKDLHAKIDVIIIEEAGSVWDPSVLIPIVVTSEDSMWQACDVMLVGEGHECVESKFMSSDEAAFSRHNIRSLFKRLKTQNDCLCLSLKMQYRIHPSICLILRYGIGGPPDDTTRLTGSYQNLYNSKGSSGKGFYPFCLVNTESCIEKSEQSNLDGSFCNVLEAQIIDVLLRKLLLLGTSKLQENIAIISPYSTQNDTIQSLLASSGRSLSNQTRRDFLNIKFGTIAEISGSEYNAVILSLTRSNLDGAVGSITNQECIKALTRARWLLIVIADISTFSKANIHMFAKFAKRISMGGVDAEYINATKLLPKQAPKLKLDGHFQRRKFSPLRKTEDYNLRRRVRRKYT